MVPKQATRPIIAAPGISGETTAGVIKQVALAVGLEAEFRTLPLPSELPKGDELSHMRQVVHDWICEQQPDFVLPAGTPAMTLTTGKVKGGIKNGRGFYKDWECQGNVFPTICTIQPEDIIVTHSGLSDIANDLLRLKETLDGIPPIIEPPYDNYVFIETNREFQAFMKDAHKARKKDYFAVDIETTALQPVFWSDHKDAFKAKTRTLEQGLILSCGISWGEGSAWVIDWHGLIHQNLRNLQAFRELLGLADCTFHNGPFDWRWLRHFGLDPNWTFDTMLAHYALDERQHGHALKRLSTEYYRAPQYDLDMKALVCDEGEESDEGETAFTLENWMDPDRRVSIARYNGADCDYTWRLRRDLRRELDDQDLLPVHDNILIPAAKLFIRFEEQGILIDREYLESVDRAWAKEMDDLEDLMREFPGAEDLNFKSPKQVATYLYDTLNLRTMKGNKEGVIEMMDLLDEIQDIEDEEAQDYWRSSSSVVTRGMKERSTSTYMLYWLAQQHEFPRLMVRHRILGKRRDAYCEGIRKRLLPDGRLRPHYRMIGTRTGRLSTSNPNIHGIPRSKEIKTLFIADPGYSWISADYSQAEVRMVAHFAKDKDLVQAMSEQDIHTSISKHLFHMTDEELANLSSEERGFRRRAAKTIAFGLIYGRTAKGLAPQLGVDEQEAKEYMDAFFQMMPGVQRWISRQHTEILSKRFVQSLFGRRRRFDIIKDKGLNAIKRKGVNMPIQSSVSDMTVLAYEQIIADLEAEGIPYILGPHVHDGIYFQVPTYLVDPAVEICKKRMLTVPFQTDVPFAAEISVGPDWGHLKTVFEGHTLEEVA